MSDLCESDLAFNHSFNLESTLCTSVHHGDHRTHRMHLVYTWSWLQTDIVNYGCKLRLLSATVVLLRHEPEQHDIMV